MTDQRRPAAVGFHSGELAVQQRAGVRVQAARLAPMVSRGELRPGLAAFLSDTTFAALTARDRTGRLWTSPLLGPPGLLRAASSTTLRIDTTLPAADPLHGLPDGQPVGLIAIDFTTRRRVRINGILTSGGASGLAVDVEQAYGNCPQYIQQRRLHIDPVHPDADRSRVFSGEVLRPEDIRLVQAAETFFLGTTHPDSGNDASHRGGPPGFVRVADDHLWWPDYPGNNMFNSFGNLSIDPTATLSGMEDDAVS
jgi:predicted pyridoxine 5'-phosphate oxidase superfamily flavin-nucleotide-binding protein